MKSLKKLYIYYSLIDFIPEYAFEFNEVSDKRLIIHLYGNKFLNSSGFAEYSLTKLKRPSRINLNNFVNTLFPYLNQKIFEPFLRSNDKNQIELYDGTLNCSDCRNYWLQRNPELLKKVINKKCSSKKELNDTANFQKCGNK